MSKDDWKGVKAGHDYSLVVNPRRNLGAKPLVDVWVKDIKAGQAYSISKGDVVYDRMEAIGKGKLQITSLRLNDLRDAEAASALQDLGVGQVDLLRVEGLSQKAAGDEIFTQALRVVKIKLACNCQFSWEALDAGSPTWNTSTSEASRMGQGRLAADSQKTSGANFYQRKRRCRDLVYSLPISKSCGVSQKTILSEGFFRR